MKLRPNQKQASLAAQTAMLKPTCAALIRMVTRCHGAGQRVLMFDGTVKAVEDVAVGDLLMGPDSTPRTVLELHTGIDDIYTIRPVKGAPWTATGSHVICTRDTRTKRRNVIEEITVNDWFSQPPAGRYHRKMFHVGVDFPPLSRPLPIDPYFLGLLLGDGHVGHGHTITLATMDQEIADALAEFAPLYRCSVIAETTLRSRARVYHIVLDANTSKQAARRLTGAGEQEALPCFAAFSGQTLHERLHYIGLRDCRAHNKFIPAAYKTASKAERLSMLAGLMDTDGSHNLGGYDYISKSPQLANDVAFIARSVGLSAYVRACRKGCQTGAVGTYHRVSITGHTNTIPCRVPRKIAPPRSQRANVLNDGFTIDPTPTLGRYYGFTIDRDHRYLLDDFTVTHNSGKLLACAASLHALQSRGALPASVGVFTSRVRLVRDLIAALWRVLDPAARSFSAAALDANRGWGTRAVQAARRLSRIVGPLGSGAQVQVGAYPSLRGQRFDLLICDEAHRTKGKRVRREVEAHPQRIGWTATPHGRDDRDGLPFDELAFDFPYQDAVDAGVIVPWERVEYDGPAIPYEGDGIDAAGRLLPVALSMIAGRGGPDKIGPILFTAPNLTVAAWMAEQIRAFGYTAEAAIPRRKKGDPGLSRRQIDRLLTRFERGEVGCLVTVDLLAEGVTIPALRAIALCCAPRGRNHLCQIAGRAMGTCPPDRWGTKTTALLFDPACILRAFKLEHPAAMGKALDGRPKSVARAALERAAELVALPWAQRVEALEKWSGAIRLASDRLRADMPKRHTLAIAERSLPATERELSRLRSLAGLVRYVQPEAHREAVRSVLGQEGLPCGVVDDLGYALARVARAREALRGAPHWRLAQVVVKVPEGVGLPGCEAGK